jgi:hypothetical protein
VRAPATTGVIAQLLGERERKTGKNKTLDYCDGRERKRKKKKTLDDCDNLD